MVDVHFRCECGSQEFYITMKEYVSYDCRIQHGVAYSDDEQGDYIDAEFSHRGFCRNCEKEYHVKDVIWG